MNTLLQILEISFWFSITNMAINIVDYLFDEYKDQESTKVTMQMILIGFIPIINLFAIAATIDDIFFNNEDEDDIWNKQS